MHWTNVPVFSKVYLTTISRLFLENECYYSVSRCGHDTARSLWHGYVHVAAVQPQVWICCSVCTLISWVSSFNTEGVGLATEFNQEDVLNCGRWGPSISSWCAATPEKETGHLISRRCGKMPYAARPEFVPSPRNTIVYSNSLSRRWSFCIAGQLAYH